MINFPSNPPWNRCHECKGIVPDGQVGPCFRCTPPDNATIDRASCKKCKDTGRHSIFCTCKYGAAALQKSLADFDDWSEAMDLLIAFVERDEGKPGRPDLYRDTLAFLHRKGEYT